MKTCFDYNEILGVLREITPETHIAGGAVRDTILKKQIHDIDVFVADEHVEETAAKLRSEWSYIKVGEWREYLGLSDPAMTRVCKFESAANTTPLCIIGLKSKFASPEANIGRFDFGICMAAYDGEEIIRTEEFDYDEKNKTFTLCRADNLAQYSYSMSRFEKITAERYAGWSLCVPEEFAELLKEHALRRNWFLETGKYGGENMLRPKKREFVTPLQ